MKRGELTNAKVPKIGKQEGRLGRGQVDHENVRRLDKPPEAAPPHPPAARMLLGIEDTWQWEEDRRQEGRALSYLGGDR